MYIRRLLPPLMHNQKFDRLMIKVLQYGTDIYFALSYSFQFEEQAGVHSRISEDAEEYRQPYNPLQ